MKKLFSFILVSVLLLACGSNTNADSSGIAIRYGVKIKYLDSAQTVYTRCIPEDTVVLEGRTFIKVWGISNCTHHLPILIEVK